MTSELMNKMTAAQIERAHAAYTQLAALYEDICDGPYQARAYKEYFAIMDNRERLRRRFVFLTTGRDGNE